MSFVSTNNKSGMGGLTTTTPPITGESGGVTADSVAGSVADAAEAAVEQAAGSLFGALPEPSGLVKAAVAAAQVWRRMRYRPSSLLLQAGRGRIM
ncbi:hypothetical protein FE138_14930 [Salmonella enterica]|nr:hypothetical protein [Salmonella enterica]